MQISPYSKDVDKGVHLTIVLEWGHVPGRWVDWGLCKELRVLIFWDDNWSWFYKSYLSRRSQARESHYNIQPLNLWQPYVIHRGASKSRPLFWHRNRNTETNRIVIMLHYSGVIMGTMVSQITSLTIVYSALYSGADQRKYQSSASLAFVRGIHPWPVNSLHKWPVTRKMFPFGDVIMEKVGIRCMTSLSIQCYAALSLKLRWKFLKV